MSAKNAKKSILVPVDFSPPSEAALVEACKLAECMKVDLTVLHVVHDPQEMPDYYAKLAKKKYLVRLEDMAKEMMDDFINTVALNHPELKSLKKPHSMLVLGVPVTRILQVAEKIDAVMVVMGSRGYTGLKHLLLGSLAEHVVRLCPIPVTIVKSGSDKLKEGA